jgi:hypothetical protein
MTSAVRSANTCPVFVGALDQFDDCPAVGRSLLSESGYPWRMPSDGRKHAIELVAGGIAVALLFAYSVLVIGRPLIAIGLVIPLVVLYLLWRLVRATERIADVVEDDGPAADRSTDEDSISDDGPGVEWDDDDGDAGAP